MLHVHHARSAHRNVLSCCCSVVDIQISPDNFVEFEHGIQQMVAWAFEPADDKVSNAHSVQRGCAGPAAEAADAMTCSKPSRICLLTHMVDERRS